MGKLLGSRLKWISIILIGLMILLNIFMFNSLPPEMLIKVNANQTMPKLIVLCLCPILSVLIFWVSSEREEQASSIVNIVVQLVLFISNLVLIYTNMK